MRKAEKNSFVFALVTVYTLLSVALMPKKKVEEFQMTRASYFQSKKPI